MRTIWYRGTAVGASVAIAIAMLFVNYAFEAAGSVTDVPPAGFLAGNLAALAVIYPILAALLTGRALMPIASRFPVDDRRIFRCGGISGLLGALLYFGLGAALLAMKGRVGAAPAAAWAMSLAYIGLVSAGGLIGALLALNRARAAALRRSEG